MQKAGDKGGDKGAAAKEWEAKDGPMEAAGATSDGAGAVGGADGLIVPLGVLGYGVGVLQLGLRFITSSHAGTPAVIMTALLVLALGYGAMFWAHMKALWDGKNEKGVEKVWVATGSGLLAMAFLMLAYTSGAPLFLWGFFGFAGLCAASFGAEEEAAGDAKDLGGGEAKQREVRTYVAAGSFAVVACFFAAASYMSLGVGAPLEMTSNTMLAVFYGMLAATSVGAGAREEGAIARLSVRGSGSMAADGGAETGAEQVSAKTSDS